MMLGIQTATHLMQLALSNRNTIYVGLHANSYVGVRTGSRTIEPKTLRFAQKKTSCPSMTCRWKTWLRAQRSQHPPSPPWAARRRNKMLLRSAGTSVGLSSHTSLVETQREATQATPTTLCSLTDSCPESLVNELKKRKGPMNRHGALLNPS